MVRAVKASGKPFVAVNCFSRIQGINRVNVDVFQAGNEAAKHLIKQGRKRIAFVATADMKGGCPDQYRGYEQAMVSDGRRPLLYHLPVNEAPKKDTLKAIVTSCDGIVAARDEIASILIKASQNSGRRVPDDLAVIGYFNGQICNETSPALSSVRMPSAHSLGQAAAQRLNDIIAAPNSPSQSILLPIELVIRASSAANNST